MPEGGGSLPGGSLLVPSFEVLDCVAAPAASIAARAGARAPTGRAGRRGVVRGAHRRHVPSSCAATSGHAAVERRRRRRRVGGPRTRRRLTERVTAGFDLASAPLPVAVEVWESPAWTCAAPPCREDYGAWVAPPRLPHADGRRLLRPPLRRRRRHRRRRRRVAAARPLPRAGDRPVRGDARGRPRRRRASSSTARRSPRPRMSIEPLTSETTTAAATWSGRRRLRRRQRGRGRSGLRTDNCVYDPDAGTDFSSSTTAATIRASAATASRGPLPRRGP